MSSDVLTLIDHAVLHPTQAAGDVREACEFCRRLGVASVCVKPSAVALAAELLQGAATVPSTVIGFPHGGTTTAAKVAETQGACGDGAVEVDMVVNLGAVLAGEWAIAEDDVAAVVGAAARHGAITKVIFETGLLPDDDAKRRLCEVSRRAGAAFVKTSTGFGYVKNEAGRLVATGATEHDVRLMRQACPSEMGVKASGGVRSLDDARRMIAAGATRIGASATLAIAADQRDGAGY